METNKEFTRLRIKLGLSQEEVADLLDRSASWVRGIEKRSNPNHCPRYAVFALRYLTEQPDVLSQEGS